MCETIIWHQQISYIKKLLKSRFSLILMLRLEIQQVFNIFQ